MNIKPLKGIIPGKNVNMYLGIGYYQKHNDPTPKLVREPFDHYLFIGNEYKNSRNFIKIYMAKGLVLEENQTIELIKTEKGTNLLVPSETDKKLFIFSASSDSRGYISVEETSLKKYIEYSDSKHCYGICHFAGMFDEGDWVVFRHTGTHTADKVVCVLKDNEFIWKICSNEEEEERVFSSFGMRTERIKQNEQYEKLSKIIEKDFDEDSFLLAKTFLDTIFWKLHPREEYYIVSQDFGVARTSKLVREIDPDLKENKMNEGYAFCNNLDVILYRNEKDKIEFCFIERGVLPGTYPERTPKPEKARIYNVNFQEGRHIHIKLRFINNKGQFTEEEITEMLKEKKLVTLSEYFYKIYIEN